MDMRLLVGRNVLRLRLQAGLTQEQLSVKSGFGQNYLSGLEKGRRNPTVLTLHHLAQALGTTPVALITPDKDAAAEG